MTSEKDNHKLKVAVLGATGYTGAELIRLLLNHPGAEIAFVSSESYAGQKLSGVHPQFTGMTDIECSPLDPKTIPGDVEIVFCALPHGKSADVVPELLDRGFRVIDLSADFRLKDQLQYPLWYDRPHPHPGLLEGSVYGLPELYRHRIKDAQLLANPGCYPTAVLLALAPLMREKALDTRSIIIDAKSGVSGAGRSPRQPFHYPESNDNFKAYRVASHQHIPEIEQELTLLDAENGEEHITVTFIPHLVPMNRGILATVYVSLSGDRGKRELLEIYRSFYNDEPFVKVLEPPALPETRWVRGTNFCHMSLRKDDRTGRIIIISAIDNLVKGASGQAVQNMNIMCGRDEKTGLNHPALTP